MLKSITFVYGSKEDRILAAINAEKPDAWSCWLTRRLVLVLLERATALLASTSTLAQQAPAEIRGALVEFERDVAIVDTAKGMSRTSPDILKARRAVAEFVERLTISSRGDKFRMEFRGENGGSAAGVITRAELQRILQMLQTEVAKANWLGISRNSTASLPSNETGPKPARH
jgi:hypothetical protein